LNRFRPGWAIGLVAAVVILAVVVVVAVVAIGGGGDGFDGRVEVAGGGGSIVRLQPASEASPPVRPDDLCLPSSPAVAGAAVLDCQLSPLLDPAAARCNETGTPAEATRRCLPPDPELGRAVLGWVLTSRTDGERSLAVYVGAVSPTAESPAGTPSVATLERRYVATDRDGRWSELAVCPGDLDGNGSVELMILARSSDPARQDRPEVVVLSIGTGRAGEQAMPAMQTLLLDADVGRAQGEGCAGPMVRAVRVDARGRVGLDPERLSGSPVTTR